MKKLNILIISNYYPPFHIGGYELACRDTVEFLRQKGHLVTVLTGNKGNTAQSNIQQMGTVHRELIYIDYDNPSYRQRAEVETCNYQICQRYINQVSPDLIYLWNQQYLSLAPSLASQNSGIAKLYEIGDFWPAAYIRPGFINALKRKVKSWLPGLIGGRFDFGPCIACSHWVGKAIKEQLNARNVEVIHNGTQLGAEPQRNRNQPTSFLFCGRLCQIKGIEQSLQAFKLLLAKFPNNQLSLTCIGPIESHYKQVIEQMIHNAHLGENVQILPPTDDMKHIYQQHHVLLMPTLMPEPFGLVIIEAMANGLAVIASDRFGPAEIINNDKLGILINPEDPIAIADAMAQLIDDPGRYHEITKAGYHHVSTHFRLEMVKEKVEQVLLHAVEEHELCLTLNS
ncbi:glycosyltransferase family 4 protein [Shewanella sp. YLB-07]|uniref:glycosyltransferase family 4 protein n=1 Tax=Shewanella sp. YLB-07 TaxID=2601268 RepID=UPI00128D485B|nr:glycosyltransferase family 4 protein [Shewanella sp. YLB-07]MPY26066.1 glycosyltransferase family 4 protein [Shewanella sp. YLB-07]